MLKGRFNRINSINSVVILQLFNTALIVILAIMLKLDIEDRLDKFKIEIRDEITTTVVSSLQNKGTQKEIEEIVSRSIDKNIKKNKKKYLVELFGTGGD